MIVYFNKCLDIDNTLQSNTKKNDFTTAGASECISEINAGLKSVVLDLLSTRGSKANE